MENKYPHLKFPHTQIIHFDNGEQRVVRNVTSVESGKWTHLSCENEHGTYEVIVNPSKVLFIKVKGE